MKVTNELMGLLFEFICDIEPERDYTGTILEFFPQDRYENKKNLPLHKYGRGPFCRFRIPKNLLYEGVYALTKDDVAVYIGECQNLSERFNSRGYGTISPKNCFVGGQSTNCKINNLLLLSLKEGHKIKLWFYPTLNRHSVESELMIHFRPRWNSQLNW